MTRVKGGGFDGHSQRQFCPRDENSAAVLTPVQGVEEAFGKNVVVVACDLFAVARSVRGQASNAKAKQEHLKNPNVLLRLRVWIQSESIIELR
jgi:hypothetical protein